MINKLEKTHNNKSNFQQKNNEATWSEKDFDFI